MPPRRGRWFGAWWRRSGLSRREIRLRIEIRGELGAILRLSEGARHGKGADRGVSALVVQIKMDAGTRNRRCLYIEVAI
jgi:hypothetical protein